MIKQSKEKPLLEKLNRLNLIYDRLNLIYGSKYSFYPYYNIKHFNNLFLVSKNPILFSFYSELNKFNNINLRKGHTKDKKATVYDNVSELYNEYP